MFILMANVDNLNFKVILDDQDFNTRVEKDIEKAKELNVQLSQLLQAKASVHKTTGSRSAAKEAIDEQRLATAKAQAAAAEAGQLGTCQCAFEQTERHGENRKAGRA